MSESKRDALAREIAASLWSAPYPDGAIHGIASILASHGVGEEEGEAGTSHPNDEIRRLIDSMEWAWGLIANAHDGCWERAHPYWKEAAERWRDEHWHPALDRNSYARRHPLPESRETQRPGMEHYFKPIPERDECAICGCSESHEWHPAPAEGGTRIEGWAASWSTSVWNFDDDQHAPDPSFVRATLIIHPSPTSPVGDK